MFTSLPSRIHYGMNSWEAKWELDTRIGYIKLHMYLFSSLESVVVLLITLPATGSLLAYFKSQPTPR